MFASRLFFYIEFLRFYSLSLNNKCIMLHKFLKQILWCNFRTIPALRKAHIHVGSNMETHSVRIRRSFSF